MIFPGSSSASALAIFDTSYFPEIDDQGIDRNGSSGSAYRSPIVAINQEIRRKNAAAAAAATSGQQLGLSHLSPDTDASDPWGLTSHQDYAADSEISAAVRNQSTSTNDSQNKVVQKRRYSISMTCACMRGLPSSPLRSSRYSSRAFSFDANICPKCGLKMFSSSGTTGAAAATAAATTTAITTSPSEYILLAGEPSHAQALLHSTPHLRFLSPESADMQDKLAGNLFAQLMGWNSSGKSSGPIATVGGVGSASTGSISHHNGKHGVSTRHGVDVSLEASSSSGNSMHEYRSSLVRDRANQQAASELASLLWVLAHEMSLEDLSEHESEVFSSIFGLVHSSDKESRLAGLAAIDALLATPSADEEKKAIKFANTLATGLRAAHGDYEFLSGVSRALGHMAKRTANADFVESQITQALEWLRAERSDRRLAACLLLKEFAIHAPTTFHSKTSQSTLGQWGGSNEFLDHIFQAIRDPQPVVRACAADALSQCLRILVERRHLSLTGLLCQVYFSMMEGLASDESGARKRSRQAIAAAEAAQHGSLLVVATMIAYTQAFMLPRFEEVCRTVLFYTNSPRSLIRLEVVRLIPRLARRHPKVFGRRYLEKALVFLIESASTPTPSRVGVDIRPSAYTSIGQLILAMTDIDTGVVIGGSNLPTIKITEDGDGHIVELRKAGIIYEKLGEIFELVRRGLKSSTARGSSGNSITESSTLCQALHCAANLVEALGDLALPYVTGLIDEMFCAGLSHDLIRCLHSIAQCVPSQQTKIEKRMLQEVSFCLAGTRDIDPVTSFRASSLYSRAAGTENASEQSISINLSDDPATVKSLVHSLQTLASFGGITATGTAVPLLPFVQDVAAQYMSHPSSEVRRAAALTCCVLLIPQNIDCKSVGGYSGIVIENVLEKLLRVAISDPSAIVRLCVVRALDARYDTYLCQSHHLQELFLILQDEAVATRAAGLKLLGRLAAINPAPILPIARNFLSDLIVELQCGAASGRGREDATRLLVVFLRAKHLQRLIHPVLASLVSALPLDTNAPPRLASASLEALGDLAEATGTSLTPWIGDVVPHVLAIMQDQSSASKQRTSLKTLGQIAGSTGYVIKPYLDFPEILTQATDILPATKRAPWSLRREVIRTLGILGALDPDRYHTVASMTIKGGAVGGAYFEEADQKSNETILSAPDSSTANHASNKKIGSQSEPVHYTIEADDDDQPAYLFMYEQYQMVAVPVSTLPPAKRLSPSDEEFYPTVAILALIRIFRDQSLAVHHGMVIQAIMFIFKSLGLGCLPYLRRVVPCMIQTVRSCSSSTLRELILQQLATLSLIAREHLRPYISDIFDIVEQFWATRHLATILSLISKIAIGVPDEFRRFVPRLIRRLITTLDQIQVSDWLASEPSFSLLPKGRVESEELGLIVRSVSKLKGVLGDYLHVLVPAFLKLTDSLASLSMNEVSGLSESVLVELSILVYETISGLLESQKSHSTSLALAYFPDDKYTTRKSSENGLPSRIVQPLARVLREKPPKNPAVGFAIIETLCVSARLVGGSKWVQLYDGMVRESIRVWQCSFPISSGNEASANSLRVDERLLTCVQLYDEVVEDLLRPPSQRNRAPSIDKVKSMLNFETSTSGWVDVSLLGSNYDSLETYGNANVSPLSTSVHAGSNTMHRVNQSNLQRAWDVSQRASRDDWDEWMRRLAIQLLREAPSPALRATASLAHAYQPLSRELFSAAFACCWKELSAPYRVNLVHALEAAFVADVSPEILQALLNLAEFMEHDGGLPINISILADLALKCRAYAKALHYREREYCHGGSGSNSCVESLISINRKLDLQEAALGVLKASSLGEIIAGNAPIEGDLLMKFSNYKGHEMFHSVIWDTEERRTSDAPVDLTAKQELWLAKLGSWSEALVVYQEKLDRDPSDFEALLGCMRCFDASGGWKKVLQLFDRHLASMSVPRSPPVNQLQLREDIAPRSKRKAIRMCAHASWRLGQWDDLEKFSSELLRGPTAPTSTKVAAAGPADVLPRLDFDGAFYCAILHIHRKEWPEAAEAIDTARKAMDGRLTALMAESYSRAYPSMVTCQTLSEMEEIIEFRKVEEQSKRAAHHHPANRPSKDIAREKLLSVWRERLLGCRVDADVHASILAVRSLVVGPDEEVDATLRLSELSCQAQRYKFAERVLLRPLTELTTNLNGPSFGFGLSETYGTRVDFASLHDGSLPSMIERVVLTDLKFIIPDYGSNHVQWGRSLIEEAGGLDRLMIQHQLYFAFVKHQFLVGARDEAFSRLENLCEVVDMISKCEGVADNSLQVSCWLELGDWKLTEAAAPNALISERLQLDVLTSYKRATLLEKCGYRAWHAWALLNFRVAAQMDDSDNGSKARSSGNQVEKRQRNHAVAAVRGFVNAISLGKRKQSALVQQDLLNLLTCLFKYGNLQDVANVINDCIVSVALEAWLGVLPQLLARIHIKDTSIRAVLHPLLIKLGEKHPQALMYPLSVLLKSPVAERKNAAESLMNTLKEHSSDLVEEALMVSSELIRIAILWLETWHEGLEDASRLYFVEGNVAGMLEILLPLHEKVEEGAQTLLEKDFLKNFGQDLAQAHLHIKEYTRLVTEDGSSVPTGPTSNQNRHTRQSEEAEAAMNRAWDIYYTFFRRVNKQLPSFTTLELSQCSPALSRARSLELGVPGSYRVDGSYIKIEKFVSNINVITSKQRPRKITLRGSDGQDYMFLLKGHEDLRQDERVMQLFGLVNALLVRDPETKKHDLRIQRYAISPLSHNCGVVGWVPHCDTLHSLIRDYRQSKKIPLNMENREMLKLAPDYDLLTVMQKVEVFTEALRKTTGKGMDLYEILWLKSTNSEEWLERRTKYTRSLAVMSIVGYILGLGDRHPSNLMLDKLSGRVLHIDFGDCFEVSMNRDKYPEKVPFRLTRMLIKAMEISGIEGSYRSTCESTMSVLRASRDSLVAMLEAFVYDPLISWRLGDLSPGGPSGLSPNAAVSTNAHGDALERRNNPLLQEPISEHPNEDGDDDDDDDEDLPVGNIGGIISSAAATRMASASRTKTSRSLQMYSNIQNLAANLSTESRIASITGDTTERMAAEGSIARSRIERSMRQRELLSLLEGEEGAAHEEALNEKALKVIRRVQDKLTGTDFGDDEPIDVTDQVQRLIVQATSSEHLCQLFVGWCAFW